MPESENQSTGIFGGSFNPPHIGHVLACHYALLRWGLKRVIVVPSYQHPFGKPLVEFPHRLEMLRLAYKHLGNTVEISTTERDREGPSYTWDTIQELRRLHPHEDYRLIIGSDLINEFPTWKNSEEISRYAAPLILPRMDAGNTSGPIPAVSSSEIRAAIAGKIATADLIPAAVARYIEEHGLYNV